MATCLSNCQIFKSYEFRLYFHVFSISFRLLHSITNFLIAYKYIRCYDFFFKGRISMLKIIFVTLGLLHIFKNIATEGKFYEILHKFSHIIWKMIFHILCRLSILNMIFFVSFPVYLVVFCFLFYVCLHVFLSVCTCLLFLWTVCPCFHYSPCIIIQPWLCTILTTYKFLIWFFFFILYYSIFSRIWNILDLTYKYSNLLSWLCFLTYDCITMGSWFNYISSMDGMAVLITPFHAF